MASELWDPLVSATSELCFRGALSCLSFYMGDGGLNLDPHGCVAGPLSMSHLHGPLVLSLQWILESGIPGSVSFSFLGRMQTVTVPVLRGGGGPHSVRCLTDA